MSLTSQIIGAQSAVSQNQVQTQISTAVAVKQLDAQRAAGDSANQLLEAAARLSKQVGSGNQFDSVG